MNIHQSIIEGWLLSNIIVEISLVDTYEKCGSIDKACEMFEWMPQISVVAWNLISVGYENNIFVEN